MAGQGLRPGRRPGPRAARASSPGRSGCSPRSCAAGSTPTSGTSCAPRRSAPSPPARRASRWPGSARTSTTTSARRSPPWIPTTSRLRWRSRRSAYARCRRRRPRLTLSRCATGAVGRGFSTPRGADGVAAPCPRPSRSSCSPASACRSRRSGWRRPPTRPSPPPTPSGYPVVAKLNGDAIAHKTERGLVRLGLADADAVRRAAAELLAAATPDDGDVDVLVAPMVRGNRELIAGVLRDPQFGPTVMLGVGGILAEAVADVVFRPAPVDAVDRPRDDRPARRRSACSARSAARRPSTATPSPRRSSASARVAAERADVASVDVNPLIVDAGRRAVAVDALVEVGDGDADAASTAPGRRRPPSSSAPCSSRAACSSPARRRTPASSASCRCTTCSPAATRARVFGTNLQGEEVLGIRTVADVADLPDGEIDLVFVCTPASANLDAAAGVRGEGRQGGVPDVGRLRRGGRGGQAGRGRAGRPRRRARHPARRPERPGRRQHAGQAVRPDRRPVPAGRTHRRRQPERQLRVQLPQLRPGDRRRHQPGRVGRQRRRRRRSPTTSTTTPTTRRPPSGWPTSRASPTAGRCSTASPAPPRASRSCSSRAGRPRAGPAPRRATPARSPPTTRCSTARAGPPGSPGPRRSRRRSRRRRRSPPSRRPPGPNVVVLTTAGGWGVVTADAITRDGDLRLLALPDDLRDAIDALLPPRWSRNNPVDCAGGETRDTIPDVMRLIAEHPDVHAVVYLGIGIQSNQARMMRDGPLLPRPRPRAHRRLPRAPGRPLRRGRRRAQPGAPASRS